MAVELRASVSAERTPAAEDSGLTPCDEEAEAEAEAEEEEEEELDPGRSVPALRLACVFVLERTLALATTRAPVVDEEAASGIEDTVVGASSAPGSISPFRIMTSAG